MKASYWFTLPHTALSAFILLAISLSTAMAQEESPQASPPSRAALPPIPEPQGLPQPGPATDAPYAPQTILPGGVVMTLFPPGSPYLKMERVREAEKYAMSRSVPGRIDNIVNIHNPSIEVHTVDSGSNTGVAIILAAGGGHTTLNVGSEACDPAAYFANYGINAVVLRNRLRRDGYNPQTDAVYDTLQAIRLVRAHAKEWRIDPNKIGVMGFSAGAELAAPAALQFPAFDEKNSGADDPLAGVSSRPDFVVLAYPGPTPFTRDPNTPIPKNVPPAFIFCAGSGDQIHAVWADAYFAAMLKAKVPNLEMHIYGNGGHAGSFKDRSGAPFGTWQNRFIEWFRDLGFLQKPGIETKAAKDVAAYASQPPREAGRSNPPAATNPPTAPNSAPQ